MINNGPFWNGYVTTYVRLLEGKFPMVLQRSQPHGLYGLQGKHCDPQASKTRSTFAPANAKVFKSSNSPCSVPEFGHFSLPNLERTILAIPVRKELGIAISPRGGAEEPSQYRQQANCLRFFEGMSQFIEVTWKILMSFGSFGHKIFGHWKPYWC